MDKSGCNLELASSLNTLAGIIATSVLCSIEAQDVYHFELFHDQLPLAVPCYDLLPVTELTVVPQSGTSGAPGFLELTGGEYKT